MKVTDENSRIRSRIRIRTKMSLIPKITIWADQYIATSYMRDSQYWRERDRMRRGVGYHWLCTWSPIKLWWSDFLCLTYDCYFSDKGYQGGSNKCWIMWCTHAWCSGSMTFWCGSGFGSADPCIWLIDADPYPANWSLIRLQKTNYKKL
jgi:hypothetical protein